MAKENKLESSHLTVTLINNKPYIMLQKPLGLAEKTPNRKFFEMTFEEDESVGDSTDIESRQEENWDKALRSIDQLTLSLFFRVAFCSILHSLHYAVPIGCLETEL